MRAEILDIAKKLYHNHLTIETGTDLLLGLLGVSGSAFDERIDEEFDIIKCPKCGGTDIIMLRVNKCTECGHQWAG